MVSNQSSADYSIGSKVDRLNLDEPEPVIEGILAFPPKMTNTILQLKKSWSKRYCKLYQRSKYGVDRLETFEIDEKSGKTSFIGVGIIALEDCLKIAKDIQKSQPNVFAMITKNQHFYFSANSEDEMEKWILAFQRVAFKDNFSTDDYEEDNELYYSSVNEVRFSVKLLPTEASNKCSLAPSCYILGVTRTSLKLLNCDNEDTLFAWPFGAIRNYRLTKEGRQTLKFEAGRKCVSGEGIFHFDQQGGCKDIYKCISTRMKEMKKRIAATHASFSPEAFPSNDPRNSSCLIVSGAELNKYYHQQKTFQSSNGNINSRPIPPDYLPSRNGPLPPTPTIVIEASTPTAQTHFSQNFMTVDVNDDVELLGAVSLTTGSRKPIPPSPTNVEDRVVTSMTAAMLRRGIGSGGIAVTPLSSTYAEEIDGSSGADGSSLTIGNGSHSQHQRRSHSPHDDVTPPLRPKYLMITSPATLSKALGRSSKSSLTEDNEHASVLYSSSEKIDGDNCLLLDHVGDYADVEVRKDAWRTMGINTDEKHLGTFSPPPIRRASSETIPNMAAGVQVVVPPRKSLNTPFTRCNSPDDDSNKILFIENKKDSSGYHTLHHFAPMSKIISPNYEQINLTETAITNVERQQDQLSLQTQPQINYFSNETQADEPCPPSPESLVPYHYARRLHDGHDNGYGQIRKRGNFVSNYGSTDNLLSEENATGRRAFICNSRSEIV